MTLKEAARYGEQQAGCWFDGHRGIYIGDAVIEEAISHGWKCDVEPAQGESWQPDLTWSDCEEYHDLWTEAEDYMQQFAEEGFWFGGNESGDWGLWASEEE